MEHFLCSPEMKPFSIVSEANVCFSVKLKRLFVLNLKIVNLKKKNCGKGPIKMEKCHPILLLFFDNPKICILENSLVVKYILRFEKQTAL